jgi:hypothetical protein
MRLWGWSFGTRLSELVHVELTPRLDLGFGCCVCFFFLEERNNKSTNENLS